MTKGNQISKALGAVQAEIQDLREKIAKKKIAVGSMMDASVTRAEALASLDQRIAYLASRYSPPVSQFIMSGREASSIWPPHPPQADSFLAWAFPDVLKAKLTAAIDKAHKETPPGLPAEERLVAIEQLQDEIQGLELTEESIIRQAAEAGFKIARRADADPRAVLAKEAA